MLILVSDLHLTDTPARSTLDVPSFERTIQAVLGEPASQAAERVTLVLLGDVLEILKSDRWLVNDVRPWEPPTDVHRKTVREIVDRILAANADFFTALRNIRDAHPKLTIEYVIGNHDWPLNTMGDGSRAALRAALSLPGGDQLFPYAHDDPDHALLAQHGHQWDEANRYRGASVAIGDAIVIDILTRLPIAFGALLGIPPEDPRLGFVHEVDNVIPQTPYRMAQWLADGLATLDATARPHLNAALGSVAEDMMQRVKPYETESPVGTWWVRALKALAVAYGPMRAALKLPPGASTPPPLARNVAFDVEESFQLHGIDYRYVVYGHTHIPDLRSISTSRGMTYYLNCGTWRRLHRTVDTAIGPAEEPYASTTAHAFVIIRHEREQTGGQPGYELRQSYHR